VAYFFGGHPVERVKRGTMSRFHRSEDEPVN